MIFEHVRNVVRWLDRANGRPQDEITLRVLKVGEEFGEAAQARIGMLAQNPRKGASHTAQEVAAELCDTVLAAFVALESLTDDSEGVFNSYILDRFDGMRAMLREGERA